jgi:hypothetical protein
MSQYVLKGYGISHICVYVFKKIIVFYMFKKITVNIMDTAHSVVINFTSKTAIRVMDIATYAKFPPASDVF